MMFVKITRANGRHAWCEWSSPQGLGLCHSKLARRPVNGSHTGRPAEDAAEVPAVIIAHL